jgi:hypothetical protein
MKPEMCARPAGGQILLNGGLCGRFRCHTGRELDEG